jgi:hypothetical protein
MTSNEFQLPPGTVAKVDQRIAACGSRLDELVMVYRALVRQVGTAGAQGYLAQTFVHQTTTKPESVGGLRDILIAAIARLAEEPDEMQ